MEALELETYCSELNPCPSMGQLFMIPKPANFDPAKWDKTWEEMSTWEKTQVAAGNILPGIISPTAPAPAAPLPTPQITVTTPGIFDQIKPQHMAMAAAALVLLLMFARKR